MNDLRKQFQAYADDRNLFFTKEREKILNAIAKMKPHFSADELFVFIKKDLKMNISRASIYNNLPYFLDSGIIREVMVGTRHKYYEREVSKKHHEHLICVNCKKIMEFDDCEMEKPIAKIEKKTGYKVIAHKIELYGICEKCRQE